MMHMRRSVPKQNTTCAQVPMPCCHLATGKPPGTAACHATDPHRAASAAECNGHTHACVTRVYRAGVWLCQASLRATGASTCSSLVFGAPIIPVWCSLVGSRPGTKPHWCSLVPGRGPDRPRPQDAGAAGRRLKQEWYNYNWNMLK